GNRPVAGKRREPPHGANRVRRRRERPGTRCGRARGDGAATPAPVPLSGGIGSAPRERDSRGILGRHHLRGAGRAHERAARHHEELDSSRTVETESLSRSMSTDDTIDPASGGNLIAAEYVLGGLGAEERRGVERRLAHEPALASEVAFWEERLGGIADAVAPIAPPPHAWSQIEGAIAAEAPPPARGSLWAR